ncbi:MAG: hypothetical protein M1608_12685, partial [Candidatus Omnitrophica bacterium]|nr:hypothetical protein [Candidatus Omnitrophota bacterium]
MFGSKCPIRHNYELLQTPLVHARLRALLELCDYNGLHVPIRQILLLLTNAVLGHPDAKDRLMVPADVPRVIVAGAASKASLYNNSNSHFDLRHRQRGKFRVGFSPSNFPLEKYFLFFLVSL